MSVNRTNNKMNVNKHEAHLCRLAVRSKRNDKATFFVYLLFFISHLIKEIGKNVNSNETVRLALLAYW